MKIFVFLALVLCAYAADVKETEKAAEPAINKEKRQTQGELVHTHLGYRTARKQEQVAPVEEPQDDDKGLSRSDSEQYRPGQVFSLNAQELLELQPERKAPLSSNQLLQQLYSSPQQEHKQNLQQIYYLEPQSARQVSYQPSSHAVIARPDYSSNGGEASVGAALSVSDSGSNPDPYNQDLLALLGQPPVRQTEEPRQQLYSQPQQQHLQQVQQTSNVQSVAPQYQQVDRYITKPSKKSKLRNKAQIAPPQPSAAPQQYLIETTNVQQQQSPLYRTAPQPQPQAQRAPQALRYVTFQQSPAVSQQVLYERPESQGLKVVPAPKLQQLQQQQPRAQLNYRLVPQYQQQEATPKQYRIIEAPRQAIRQQEHRLPSQSVERPIAYLKRFPDHEKMRSVKIYDPISEGVPQQPAQIIGEQYFLRPLYRGIEQQQQQRPRYEQPAQKSDQSRVLEPAKPPQSSIYVSKNVAAARKQARPQPAYREQPTSVEQVNLEQHGQNLDEQRAQLPPPKNNKAYTPEEFAALVAAGYAVTPVPVSALNLQEAQSRSSVESVTMYPKRRTILASRRHQYLPLRGDDAP
ncbi:putative uncharacterized protein DDB_G0271606 [Trichoplusia ni]|uniref:Mediator of RNA polymerase II transcription subunit 15-like n=1 Tax=Trichoplusia ni TaxID=7111 RepID=A0A7E5W4J1_TRINI|nr:putative uncharacterized protein DDB_G0271606 [Trichoplusia ni]